jgi:lipopolysaccharide/colanic/teichoic acid biosynthesis glycosyltransferase
MGIKRAFDILCSVFGLFFFGPLLVLISVAIKLQDGGPVFFRQCRAGRMGRDFVLFKFRTMSVQAGTEKGSFEAGSSRRVTRIGRWLRKTKLDELPQLWNVLKGDMSLVGPRPEVRKWVEAYPERWAKVLEVKPGITDPASIIFRNEEEMLAQSANPEETYRTVVLPRKLDLYEEYVRTRSFVGDISIVMKTIWVVAVPPRTN